MGGKKAKAFFYLGNPFFLRHMANFPACLLISHFSQKQTFHKAQPNAIIKLPRGCLLVN